MSVSDVAPAVPARAAAVALTKSPSASSPKRSQSPALVEKSEDGRVESSAGEGRWIGAERPLLRTNEDDSATTRAARTSQSANNSPQHGSLQRLQELSGGGECSGGGSPMMSKNYLLQRRQVSDSGGLSAASARSSLLHTVASTSGTVSAADSSAIARPCSEGTDQPHALDAWSHLRDTLAGKHLVVFLDYDGTLTPIVSEPSAAIIDAPQRQRLAALAQQYPVAIVTGRKLDTITNFLGRGGPLPGLDRIYYAGSHGFDIRCPSALGANKQVAEEYLPHLASFRDTVQRALADVPGALVEDNNFSISVHYRNVAPADRARVDDAVDAALAPFVEQSLLRKTAGHMVHEVRANFDWHKGAAVHYLMQLMCDQLRQRGISDDQIVPLYIGDDTTDEDAFRTLRFYQSSSTHPSAFSIFVRPDEKARPSAATHVLRTPAEVGQMMERLAKL